MHHLRFGFGLRFLVAAGAAVLLSRGDRASAGALFPACGARNPHKQAACVESCPVPVSPAVRASEPFLAKLRTLPSTGHHVRAAAGPHLATALSQFRVASVPFSKEAAARWRHNGLWAGPCAGLTGVFVATAVDDKDPRKVVDLYELRYGAEAAARRVAALLGSSWDWNGHPFIADQRGANVLVAEGRYGAWGTLETVAAHFAGTVPAAAGPAALALCDKGAKRQPIFQGQGVVIHVLGFAPSGALAWLEATVGQGAATVWTLHVTNLVNDRDLAVRTYRTAAPGPDAFCAQDRNDAAQLLAEEAVSGGAFSAFDGAGPDGDPLSVVTRRGPAAHMEIVMEGRPGTKVLGRLPASITSARTLGFIRSPFEERVAVLVLTGGTATQRAAVRVFGGRLDKRWIARPSPELASTAATPAR
jgi:hypothetical protein